MNREKVLTLLGFASKSANIISGQDNTLKSLGKKPIYLVFCAADMAAGSKQKIVKKCQHLSIPLIHNFTIAELSKATGKANRTVIAIKDKQFANKMLELLENVD